MHVFPRIHEKFLQELPFKGYSVTICAPINEIITVLIRSFTAGGAEVTVAGVENEQLQIKALEKGPDFIVDVGGTLMDLLHGKHKALRESLRGGVELSSDYRRLKALEASGDLAFPVVVLNHDFYHVLVRLQGKGEGFVNYLMKKEHLNPKGKRVVLLGFNHYAKWIAEALHHQGASIYVVEMNPAQAVEAHVNGFSVISLSEAVSQGDYFLAASKPLEHQLKGHLDIKKMSHEDEAIVISIEEPFLTFMNDENVTLEKSMEIWDLSLSIYALSFYHIVQLQKDIDKYPGNRLIPVPQEVIDLVLQYKIEVEEIPIESSVKN